MKETLLKRVSLLGARSRDLAYSAKEKFKELINDESGMGTVEVILIIVEIFTLHYTSLYDILHNVVLNH